VQSRLYTYGRWLGLRRRLFATCAGVGGFESRRKGALVTRHRPVPKVEAAIRKAGSSLSPWLFVLWATWDGEDFAGLGTGTHFGLSIYVINLTDFTDRRLMSAVNQVPANSVLLFEDIDCMNGSQSRAGTDSDRREKGPETAASQQNGVTLSGLLNVLDGFYAPTGVLFVMTTNHIEKLDEALLRPGRIDYKLYLGKASDRQKVELYRRFFPELSENRGARVSLKLRGIRKRWRSFKGCSGFRAGRKALRSRGNKPRNIGVERISPVGARFAVTWGPCD